MFTIFKDVKELKKEVERLEKGVSLLMRESIERDLKELGVDLEPKSKNKKKKPSEPEISKRTGKPKRKYVKRKK